MYNFLFKFLSLIFAVFVSWTPLYKQSLSSLNKEIQDQKNRIEILSQSYENKTAEKFVNSDYFLGELDTSIKFNELSYIGTHNSYQLKSNNKPITITDQLNSGILSLELDVEPVADKDGLHFVCIHSPVFDMNTSAYSFELALKEIKMWSDYNPDHLPVTVIIEPKKIYLPMEGMEYFDLDKAEKLDKIVRENLGDSLFTPKDMLREYSDFAEMRNNDDWCSVSEMQGKVLVLLHDSAASADYIKQDKSIKSQAMFPMGRLDDLDEKWASFIIVNHPRQVISNKDKLKGFIARTRGNGADRFQKQEEKYALKSGAGIISTDYPPVANDGSSHSFSFEDGKTIKSNING